MNVDRKRIVIFNVNWLGDVLFSTAVIRNIRLNYPQSYIACIIPPGCAAVLQGNPYLNEIILFDEKTMHKSIFGKFAFAFSLKQKRFNSAFLLHRSMTRAFIVWLAGIRERIGYTSAKGAFFLTTKISPPDIYRVHRIDCYLGLIKGAGLAIKDRHADFFFNEQDRLACDVFLRQSAIHARDVVIGLNPGGNWSLKRWKKESFALLADRLVKEYGVRIVFTGSAQDQEVVSQIQSLMKSNAVSACGILSLKQFAVLCTRMSVFISADSGPLHIANAVGAKQIIALFGPTDPQLTGPVPVDRVAVIQKKIGCAIPCYKLDCSDNRCMKAISVDDVLAAVRSVSYAANS